MILDKESDIDVLVVLTKINHGFFELVDIKEELRKF
jgi:predicted nucleotidyltransferase